MIKEQKFCQCSSSKTIVSYYIDGVKSSEEDLNQLVMDIQSTGAADIIKLEINATDITELIHLFHLLSHCQVLHNLITDLCSSRFHEFVIITYTCRYHL